MRPFFLLVLIFNSFFIQASVDEIRFEHYTMDEGLPNNLVDCILQDKRGFMWFGTWNGLSRFDGYHFKNFNALDSSSKGINSNYIFALYQDENENIWVGTKNGLNIYLYEEERFIGPKNSKYFQAFFNTPITTIVEDLTKNVWLGSQNRLYKTKTVKGSLSVQQIITLPNSIEQINHLYFDRHKNLWISTDAGLVQMNSLGSILRHYKAFDGSGLLNNNIRQVYEDSKHNLWIASEYGLYRFINGQFLAFLHHPDNAASLVHNSVMSLLEINNGKLLIGTLGGLSIMDVKNPGIFENYTHQLYIENSLNSDFINCLFQDAEGGVWVGTEVGGVNRYKNPDSNLESYEYRFGQKNSLSHNLINAIYDDKNFLWVGTAGGGLNRIDKKNGRIDVFRYNQASENTLFDFISAIFCDSKGQLWVGSWGMGLFKVVNKNAKIPKFINFRPKSDGSGLINDFVSSITEDKHGYIWIGTYQGLDRFDPRSGKFLHLSSVINNHSITKVGCLAVDSNNRIWVGTREGLFRLSNRGVDTVWDVRFFSTHDGLSDNYVTYLYFDLQGNLWIGTYGFGLNQYFENKERCQFNVYTTYHGLSNNIIYTINEDKYSNLWITTDYGLSRFNKQTKKFKNFYKSDGLLNNKYYWNAAFMSNSGKYYLGGLMGLNAFYPELFNNKPAKLSVTITDLKIYNTSIVPREKYLHHQIIEKSITLAQTIQVPYVAKNLSLEFSALSYDKPRHLYYSYQLEGFENQWHVVDAGKRYAVYTNLPPGKYTFKVRASAEPGIWEGPIKIISIIIIPPFWKTWWFRIATIILLSSVVIAAYQYRLNSLKRQKQKLEKLVKLRTAKIEEQKALLEEQNAEIINQRNKLMVLNQELIKANEFKINFFTNISHEFKTPLTLIIDPLKELIDFEKLSGAIKEKMKIIWYNALRMQYLINQLIEFRKIEQGKFMLQVSENKVTELVSNIVKSFDSLAIKKKIDLKLVSHLHNENYWFDAHKLEIILFNLLSNAFKNTPSGGSVCVTLRAENELLIISVEDTGIGIEPHLLNKIFERFYQIKPSNDIQKGGTGLGLSIVKEYVDIHRGTIHVHSTVGKGTKFEIHIPANKQSYLDEEVINTNTIGSTFDINQYVTALEYELSTWSAPRLLNFPDKPNRPTILIVEDHSDLLNFLANTLYRNYNVRTASNGKDGYRIASEETPDIVVSDVMLPQQDGFELCQALKTNLFTSHIPVILLTAKSSTEDELEGIKRGADVFLPKPFDLNVLMGYIENLLVSRQKLFETFRQQAEYNVSNLVTNSLDKQFINKVTSIIDENIDNSDFSVSELAEAMAMSRSNLHKKLTALTGMAPVDFLNHHKLKKSIAYLLQGYSISEAAYSVGYNDPKYYARIFRKFFGITPTEYKNRVSKIQN
ncbi:MAG: ATP-binding protein [Bacteroidales bacterium]|nr:ATP-binding protein [Bacteroidales bacterium]